MKLIITEELFQSDRRKWLTGWWATQNVTSVHVSTGSVKFTETVTLHYAYNKFNPVLVQCRN